MRQLGLARALRQWAASTDPREKVNAAKAVRAMRQLGLAKALRQWMAATDPREKVNAIAAVRAMRHLGLARAWRQWAIVADESHRRLLAERSLSAMRQLGLAKALRQWMAATDPRHKVIAEKALYTMRQLGLAKALRQWMAATDPREKVNAIAAVRAMRHLGLERAWRQWAMVTDYEARDRKVLQRAMARWRGGKLRLALTHWRAALLAAAAARMFFGGKLADRRRTALSIGFMALSEHSGCRSRIGAKMHHSLNAWRLQSIHAAWVRLRQLTSHEAVLKERVGRTLRGMRVRALRIGFSHLKAHRIDALLGQSMLGTQVSAQQRPPSLPLSQPAPSARSGALLLLTPALRRARRWALAGSAVSAVGGPRSGTPRASALKGCSMRGAPTSCCVGCGLTMPLRAGGGGWPAARGCASSALLGTHAGRSASCPRTSACGAHVAMSCA